MAKEGIPKVKLIQLNVWWGGKLTGNLAKFVKDQGADIMCMQEAASLEGSSGMFLPTQEIQEIGNFKDTAFAPMVTINFMHRKASMGNAIASKFPFLKTDSAYIYLEHNDDFDWDKHDYNVRNFLHCVLDVKGKQVHVITHHGYHIPEHKNGDSESLRQMKEIADYIKKLDGPVILTGDFNLAPHSESLEVINSLLSNLSVKYKLKTTRNQLTHKNEVCDYIFVNDQVKVKNFEMSKELVSDHAALILDFDV